MSATDVSTFVNDIGSLCINSKNFIHEHMSIPLIRKIMVESAYMYIIVYPDRKEIQNIIKSYADYEKLDDFKQENINKLYVKTDKYGNEFMKCFIEEFFKKNYITGTSFTSYFWSPKTESLTYVNIDTYYKSFRTYYPMYLDQLLNDNTSKILCKNFTTSKLYNIPISKDDVFMIENPNIYAIILGVLAEVSKLKMPVHDKKNKLMMLLEQVNKENVPKIEKNQEDEKQAILTKEEKIQKTNEIILDNVSNKILSLRDYVDMKKMISIFEIILKPSIECTIPDRLNYDKNKIDQTLNRLKISCTIDECKELPNTEIISLMFGDYLMFSPDINNYTLYNNFVLESDVDNENSSTLLRPLIYENGIKPKYKDITKYKFNREYFSNASSRQDPVSNFVICSSFNVGNMISLMSDAFGKFINESVNDANKQQLPQQLIKFGENRLVTLKGHIIDTKNWIIDKKGQVLESVNGAIVDTQNWLITTKGYIIDFDDNITKRTVAQSMASGLVINKIPYGIGFVIVWLTYKPIIKFIKKIATYTKEQMQHFAKMIMGIEMAKYFKYISYGTAGLLSIAGSFYTGLYGFVFSHIGTLFYFLSTKILPLCIEKSFEFMVGPYLGLAVAGITSAKLLRSFIGSTLYADLKDIIMNKKEESHRLIERGSCNVGLTIVKEFKILLSSIIPFLENQVDTMCVSLSFMLDIYNIINNTKKYAILLYPKGLFFNILHYDEYTKKFISLYDFIPLVTKIVQNIYKKHPKIQGIHEYESKNDLKTLLLSYTSDEFICGVAIPKDPDSMVGNYYTNQKTIVGKIYGYFDTQLTSIISPESDIVSMFTTGQTQNYMFNKFMYEKMLYIGL